METIIFLANKLDPWIPSMRTWTLIASIIFTLYLFPLCRGSTRNFPQVVGRQSQRKAHYARAMFVILLPLAFTTTMSAPATIPAAVESVSFITTTFNDGIFDTQKLSVFALYSCFYVLFLAGALCVLLVLEVSMRFITPVTWRLLQAALEDAWRRFSLAVLLAMAIASVPLFSHLGNIQLADAERPRVIIYTIYRFITYGSNGGFDSMNFNCPNVKIAGIFSRSWLLDMSFYGIQSFGEPGICTSTDGQYRVEVSHAYLLTCQ